MSSFFLFIKDRMNRDSLRQNVIPLGVAVAIGCVLTAFLVLGGGGRSVGRKPGDKAEIAEKKIASGDNAKGDQTLPAETTTSRNQAILSLLEAGATMTFDETGEGSAVSFPGSMAFRHELLECLPAVNGLTTLTIDHPAMGDAGIASLIELASLKRLSLIQTAVSDQGLSNLSQHAGLVWLNIDGGNVTGASLAELAALRNLQSLRLSRLELSGETLQRVIQSPSLQTLDLTGTKVSDEAARVLINSSLKRVDLTGTGVSQTTLVALRTALPDAEILSRAEVAVPEPIAETDTGTGAVSPEDEKPEGAPTHEKPEAVPVELVSVPDEETIREARSQLQQTLKKEYASARTRSKQRELAQKLLKLSRNFDETDPVRFVILNEATQYGLKAADWAFSVEVIEELGKVFDINQHKYRADVMTQAARFCDREDAAHVGRLSLSYAHSAVDQERFEEAVALAHAALAAARRADSTSLTRQTVSGSKEVAAARQAFEEAQAARIVLKQKANDENASLTLGRYLALYRGEWSEALPFLAATGSSAWQQVASSELKGLVKASDQVKLAEQWLALIGELKTDIERKSLQAHAASWLRRAKPALPKLEQIRIEKLLTSIESKPDAEQGEGPEKKLVKANLDQAGIGQVTATNLVGGPGGAPFRWMIPRNSILIGIRVSATQPIAMLQPIYQTEAGNELGPIFGEESNRHVDIIANRGYQVGGLALKTGDFIKGIAVTFVEIRPRNRLRPRWYDSRYVGDVGPGRVSRLGSADVVVVGLHGRAHTLVDALGLIGRSRTKIADAKPEDTPPQTRTE